MAKCGKLRCGGLDIVEGVVKTLDVFDKSILGGKEELIFQNARCKERMWKLCVFRDGIYLPRLVFTLLFTYLYLLTGNCRSHKWVSVENNGVCRSCSESIPHSSASRKSSESNRALGPVIYILVAMGTDLWAGTKQL
jgi:hypothetical protein